MEEMRERRNEYRWKLSSIWWLFRWNRIAKYLWFIHRFSSSSFSVSSFVIFFSCLLFSFIFLFFFVATYFTGKTKYKWSSVSWYTGKCYLTVFKIIVQLKNKKKKRTIEQLKNIIVNNNRFLHLKLKKFCKALRMLLVESVSSSFFFFFFFIK